MSGTKQSYLGAVFAAIAVAVVVAFLVYLNRQSLSQWHLSKDQAALWQIVFQAVAGFLAIGTALIAALKYLHEKAEHTEIAERESRKDFFAKRQEIYFQMVRAVSQIMNLNPGEEGWDLAVRSFWIIYWGEISLVSDKSVNEAVERFSDALWDYKGDEKKLSDLSAEVVSACRTSLGETWNFEQSVIPDSPYRSILDRFTFTRT